jgi:hypothetical protein
MPLNTVLAINKTKRRPQMGEKEVLNHYHIYFVIKIKSL